MNIFIEGKDAVLKNNLSFDYISENRLFSGRDGYTLNITFPLKDCPENIEIFGHIDRTDVDKSNSKFDCLIVDGKLSLAGLLLVVKVSEKEVECQFAEGRCAQTASNPLDDVYINALDLGEPSKVNPSDITPLTAWKSIDEGADSVALPWVNENAASVSNNWVTFTDSSYEWAPYTGKLSWMPYLIVIAKKICEQIGYEYDFDVWEASPFKYLIICNVIPGSWGMPGYASALPNWSVSAFFEKLELFLMCEFEFDHKAKTVSMRFSKDIVSDIAPVEIDNPVNLYSVDLSQSDDSSSCNYIAAKRLAYKQCSHSMWNFYSCDWYIHNNKKIRVYETLSDLIMRNKRRESSWDGINSNVHWGETIPLQRGSESTVNYLLYATDVDTYFAFRSIGVEVLGQDSWGHDLFAQKYVLQSVNVFGSGSVEDENSQSEEIEFVPPCIMDTYVSDDDDKGYMLFMSPLASSSSDEGLDSERPAASRGQAKIIQPRTSSSIANGKQESSSSAFYDEIYVAFWDGANSIVEGGKTPYPIIDSRSLVSQGWSDRHTNRFSMRLYGKYASLGSFFSQLPQIDPKQKFKFSWLSSEVPNPRAIFYINGKRYLCEKITATFTENGMSQLLTGEFYPLID